MKGHAKRALLLLVFVSLIVSVLAFSNVASTAQAGTPEGAEQWPFDPIRVNSDTELADLITTNGWNGTGVEADPYIIENLSITVTAQDSGIFLGNTTKYVVVRNCTISGFFFGMNNEFREGAGVQLFNARNVTISYNDLMANSRGVHLSHGSNFNDIAYNNCSDGSYYPTGIFLDQSNNNSIFGNVCNNNVYGMWLLQSNGNEIGVNNCSTNTYVSSGDLNSGIRLSSSNDNVLAFNRATGNPYYGIFLEMSTGNVVGINLCEGNGHSVGSNLIGAGILVWDGCDNLLEYNMCTLNLGPGIYLYGESCNNNVTENLCNENDGGIVLYTGCTFNNVTFNICNDNGMSYYGTGLFLFGASYNTVSNNSCDGNWIAGIAVIMSNNNTLEGNNCSENLGVEGSDDYGIVLINSRNNTIADNTCYLSGYYGIRLMNSPNNTVSGNICEGNVIGIDLEHNSTNNTVSGNLCVEGDVGIFVGGSDYNTIVGNTCTENIYMDMEELYAGIYLEHSDHNSVSDNICYDNVVGIYLVFSNYTAIDGNDCSYGDIGIYLDHSENNTVTNNDCNGNDVYDWWYYWIGIYLEYANNNTVANNYCYDNWYGIYLYTSRDCLVEANTCEYNVDGIYLDRLTDVSVYANTCFDNDIGIYSNTIDHTTIEANVCYDNGESGIYGYYLDYSIVIDNVLTDNYDGIILWYSDHNEVSGNEISGSVYRGILLDGMSDYNLVKDNILSDNGFGIRLYWATYNTVEENTVTGGDFGIYLRVDSNYNTIVGNTIFDTSEYGIYLCEGSSYNMIYGNELLYNNHSDDVFSSTAVQAFDSGTNYWNSPSNGNFWSDWTAPDYNGNGFVDVPYSVEGGSNFDRMPLALDLMFVSPEFPFYTNEITDLLIRGNASAYYGIESITWFNELTGGTGACAFTLGTMNWTTTVPLGLGFNTIVFTIVDDEGHESVRTVVALYDNIDPTISLYRPVNGTATALNEVSLAWRGEDTISGIAAFEVYLDGTLFNTTTDRHFILSGLEDGIHVVQVKAVDKCGNFALSANVSFIVDTTGPIVEITSPADGSYSLDNDVKVEFVAEDELSAIAYYIVNVGGFEWIRVDGTNYTFVGLADGPHTIVVGAYDVLGNYAQTSIVVIVDTVEPTVVVSPEGSEIDIDAIVVAQFSKPMKTMDVWIVGVAGFSFASVDRITYTPDALEYNREYTVVLSGEDLAGHVINVTWTFETMIKVGDIEGKIVDKDGKPLANVTVTLSNGETTRTNAEGRFVFADVDQGSYNVTFSKDGYVTGNATAVVIADETDDLGKIKLATTPKATSDNALLIVAIVAGAMAAILVAALLMRRKP